MRAGHGVGAGRRWQAAASSSQPPQHLLEQVLLEHGEGRDDARLAPGRVLVQL